MPSHALGRVLLCSVCAVGLYSGPAWGQATNSGDVTGSVTDQSGAIISDAGVQIRNPVTGYEQSVKTDDTGAFRFNNIPQNPYQLTVTADRFAPVNQAVDVRGSLPITVNITLKVAAEITTVDVAASGSVHHERHCAGELFRQLWRDLRRNQRGR